MALSLERTSVQRDKNALEDEEITALRLRILSGIAKKTKNAPMTFRALRANANLVPTNELNEFQNIGTGTALLDTERLRHEPLGD